jgi:hypothetical protein
VGFKPDVWILSVALDVTSLEYFEANFVDSSVLLLSAVQALAESETKGP